MRRSLQVAAAAALLAFVPANASAEQTLRVTLQLPETHPLRTNWKDFGKIISEKSDGKLKIQLFPSAQLFTDKQMPGAVGSGAVDAGSAFIGRFAGSVPAVDVISIPFIFKDEA